MHRIEDALRSLRQGDAGNAPRDWIERAQAIEVSMAPLPRSGAFVADLVFDSGRHDLIGVRADVVDARQFVLTSPTIEIEVTLLPSGTDEPWSMSGQIFSLATGSPALGGVQVRLIEADQVLEEGRTSDAGEFSLERRPQGAFRLSFEGPDWSVETPVLEP